MFLKRERHVTDDFAIKEISGCEGKILSRNFNISRYNVNSVSRHPYKKKSGHVFAFSFVSEHSEHFLFFPFKNLHFLSGQGSPPPLTDMPAKNVFFGRLPLCLICAMFFFYSVQFSVKKNIPIN